VSDPPETPPDRRASSRSVNAAAGRFVPRPRRRTGRCTCRCCCRTVPAARPPARRPEVDLSDRTGVVRNDHAALVAGPLAVERDGSDRRALVAQTAGGGERETRADPQPAAATTHRQWFGFSVISGYSKTTVLGPLGTDSDACSRNEPDPLNPPRSKVLRDAFRSLRRPASRAPNRARRAPPLPPPSRRLGVRRRPEATAPLAGRLRRRRTRALLETDALMAGSARVPRTQVFYSQLQYVVGVQRRRIVRGDAGRRSNRTRTPVRLPDRRLRRDVRRRPTGDDRDRAVRSRVRRRVDAGGGGDLRRRERRPEPGGRDGRPVPRTGCRRRSPPTTADERSTGRRSEAGRSIRTPRRRCARWPPSAGPEQTAAGSRPPSAAPTDRSRSSSGRTRRRSRRRSRPRRRRTRPSSSRGDPRRL